MITVLGAGSIGCHMGGMLAAAGHPVTLIGRPALVKALGGGLTTSAMDGVAHRSQPIVTDDPSALADTTLILLCVKSADTHDAGALIKTHAPPDVHVVSLQNGITNPKVLGGLIGPDRIVPGMVGFNVVRSAPDHFTQTTEGEVILAKSGAILRDHLSDTPITALCHDNMEGVQWSKLLMNLNNALNALSGLGLRDQLQTRAWRQALAACIAEGLAVARAEGIALERIGKVHPRILPSVLCLPDFIFRRVANAMLRVDPAARSSMADDYAAGRPPEVAWLNGYIVDRGALHDVPTPVNRQVCALVERAFDTADRTPLAYNPQDIFVS